jgi:PTH1 family peptidyl-tRNA hydrolase
MRFYKISPADVIVFHDELDLEPGKVRVKSGGGHAGHNGLRSISAHIGNDFARLRIGIGHPGSREAVVHYVLHDFARADREWLQALLPAIAQALPHLITGQDAKFMNEVVRVYRPAPAKPAKGSASERQAKAVPAARPKSGPELATVAAKAPADKQTSLGAKLLAWLNRA